MLLLTAQNNHIPLHMSEKQGMENKAAEGNERKGKEPHYSLFKTSLF